MSGEREPMQSLRIYWLAGLGFGGWDGNSCSRFEFAHPFDVLNLWDYAADQRREVPLDEIEGMIRDAWRANQ